VRSLPDVRGLRWSQIRALAQDLAAAEPAEALVAAAVPLLDAPETARRVLAVYLLGFASGRAPAALAVLRDIRCRHPDLVDAETATRDLTDPGEPFTYPRVLAAR
jgi:hypothetical protein